MLPIYAFVVAGALLLFMLQPLVGRLLLPAFGGGFQVWTTCIMFFQGILLAGYAYAHLVLPRIGRAHRWVVGGSLLALPIGVGAVEASSSGVGPILVALLTVALPFGVLATTSIGAQLAWLRSRQPGDPYSLYALSNAGSLIGLLSYPFLVEPWLALTLQRWLWSAGYILYAWLAWRIWQRVPAGNASMAAPARPASPRRQPYWFMLSAAGVILMLAVTNLIALGAGSVPLVWVLPLAAYLASYILAFRKRTLLWSGVRRHAPEIALLGMLAFVEPNLMPELLQLVLLLGSLFLLCYIAHAELYDARPDAALLTRFYLWISFGGFAGGAFVTLLAPVWFRDFDEYPLALGSLLVTLALGRRTALLAWLRARTHWAAGGRFHYLRWLWSLLLIGAGGSLMMSYLEPSSAHALRNAYGIYSVWERSRGTGTARRTLRILSHNNTNHGFQSLRAEERRMPTGYFHHDSPLGELLGEQARPARFGVVGLGAGTVASYFGRDDGLTFYEIDRHTEHLARTHFTFLSDCEAALRIVIGDARLSLERERQEPPLTGLLIDAFSGDAIPFHLLTREALALYLDRVEPGAPVIFHISNRFYELWPDLAATARSLDAAVAHKRRRRKDGDVLDSLEWASHYLVISRDHASIGRLGRSGWRIVEQAASTAWTDERVNLLAPLWRRL